MEVIENTTTRGRFLRQLAVTLAVGVGAGALASAARADHTAGHCCPKGPEDTCPGGDPTCNPDETIFHCNCTGIGSDYCVCSTRTECYNGPC